MAEIAGQAVASGAGIYEMITGGPGTWTMDRAHDAAKAQSATQDRINEKIAHIASEISGGWTGKAADGAHGATRPLADGALQSSQALRSAQNVHATQGQHFSHTAHSVAPVADSPPETDVLDTLTPWDTDTEDAVNDYNATSQRNVELYQAYGGTSQASEAAMPREFPRFAEFDGEFTVTSKDGPGGGPTNPPPHIGGGGDTTTAAGYVPPGGGTAHPPMGGGPQPGPGGAAQPGHGGGQPIAAPGATAGSGPTGGANPIGGNFGAGGVPRTSVGAGSGPAGFVGGEPASGAGAESVRGGSGFGVGSRGGSASASRGGAAAGTGSGGTGRVVGGAPGQTPGAGPKSGAVPGGATAAEAAAARGASGGTGGRGGAAGGPMAPGAGKGQGGQDKEHQRKTILIEPDEEGVFGTDELTPPPVIGGDPGHQ